MNTAQSWTDGGLRESRLRYSYLASTLQWGQISRVLIGRVGLRDGTVSYHGLHFFRSGSSVAVWTLKGSSSLLFEMFSESLSETFFSNSTECALFAWDGSHTHRRIMTINVNVKGDFTALYNRLAIFGSQFDTEWQVRADTNHIHSRTEVGWNGGGGGVILAETSVPFLWQMTVTAR